MNLLRFSVPGVAADAVNVRRLEVRARDAGVSAVRLTYQFAYRPDVDGNAYRCRITCSAQMAVFMIEQFRLLGEEAQQRGELTLAAACARGLRETYAILMAPRQRPQENRSTRVSIFEGRPNKGR